jgi:hypothetical protein
LILLATLLQIQRANACQTQRTMSTPARWLPLIKDWAPLYQRLARCSIVDIGHFCPIHCLMNADDFIKAIRKLGKAEGVEVRLEKRHGKGSYATL